MIQPRILVLPFAFLVILTACPNQPRTTYPPESATLDLETECPHTWFEDAPTTKEAVGRTTGGLEDVPELGDCQSFIAGTRDAPNFVGSRTGDRGVFAIFVSKQLDTLTRGTAAIVYAKDRGYGRLSIEEGFNCLVMRQESATVWRAAMVPVDDRPEDCATPSALPAALRELPVRVRPAAGGDVIPAAARWAFNDGPWETSDDDDSVHQYIAIKCGAAECYVGVESTPDFDGRGYLVLSDRQYLAQRPVGGGVVDQPVRPALEGTLTPDKGLADATQSLFEEAWVRVAEVELDARNISYLQKANFDGPRSSLKGPIEVFTCLDTGPNSCPRMNKTIMDDRCRALDARSGFKYRSMHLRHRRGRSSRGRSDIVTDTMFRCVQYFALPDSLRRAGFQIPGAVRWRWLAEDETLWHRCEQGCCKVD